MKKKLLSIVTLLLCTTMLAACSSNPAPSPSGSAAPTDTSLSDVIAKGELVVGLDDKFPPMGFRDANQNLVGYDIDLATEVAKRLGVKAVLQPVEWKMKELELDNKAIDVIWNGYTMTPERKEKVLFSEPYMKNEQIVLVNVDSTIQKLSDLKNKKIAVQDGSSAQDALKAQADLYSSIKTFDFKENVTALLDVESGQVDALAVDSVVANYLMTQKAGKFRLLTETLSPEEYGIGFRKTDTALRNEVQKTLDAMEADGSLKTINQKWLGKDSAK